MPFVFNKCKLLPNCRPGHVNPEIKAHNVFFLCLTPGMANTKFGYHNFKLLWLKLVSEKEPGQKKDHSLDSNKNKQPDGHLACELHNCRSAKRT